MPVTIDGSNGITTPTYGGADTSEYIVPVTQFKNRLINSAMVIDQRNAGASVTPTGSAYTLDRWQLSIGVASKLSVQQSSTAPTGFRNSALITTASAYTASAGDYLSFCQKIEGFNVADLMWGTANAQTVTLSFWVRSSLTGTFSGALQNDGASRSYPFTFTISSANTFEYKTVTIAGDTSGTWNTTTGKGVEVHFNLGSGSDRLGTAGAWNSNWNTGATGSVALVQTNGATFYITGVQLEVGSTATSFDVRPYGTELALCQRYFISLSDTSSQQALAAGYYTSTTGVAYCVTYPTTMRTNASFSSSGTFQAGLGDRTLSSLTLNAGGPTSSTIQAVCSGATAGQGTVIRGNGSAVALNFSAEL